MLKTKEDIITKIHLIISVAIVIPTSVIYGFNPSSRFDIHLNTIDELNQFKAIMGLYLGFSILWILGIFRANFLKLALMSNIVFMLGLGLGRLVSLCIDGTPTFAYQFGTIAELCLGLYGFIALRHHKYPN
ncbi:DUF4345 domain-containing protein [Winogradskyella flava]|uniref:DUF4345 domain-containing protein n=1 Tax=Winogradskyella flava TaxID=1884876 RepID=A0A842ILS5_9FLAO|nr:DUF4345 domain-containing protein [Winogradskyella flava]MBC2843920.1 DUF4345 domain-containing protein [Winogradskyella flava]